MLIKVNFGELMPVYWYSIPAKIKAVIDKTFPFGMDNENVAGKGCGLICCCAEDDISVIVFEVEFFDLKIPHSSFVKGTNPLL